MNQRLFYTPSLHLLVAIAASMAVFLQALVLPVWAEKTSGRVHATAPLEQKDQGISHLIFPSDQAVGKLFVQTSSGSRQVAATGSVDVPAGAQCRLEVNYGGAENLQWISRLPPQSVGDLNLRRLPVSEDGLKYLEHLTGLEKLDLSETDISDKGLVHLRTLKGLKKLNLGSTLIKGSGLAFLSDLDSMQELILRNNELGQTQLKYLPKLTNLIVLDIGRCQIKNDGLAKLKDLPKLWQLDLGKNAINDDGLKYLTGLTHLYALGLEETSVTVDCIRYLKQPPELGIVTISLSKNFSQSDLARVRKALPHCNVNDSQSHKGFPLELLQPLR
jgi:hypothetical protein